MKRKIPRIRALHWATDQMMSEALSQMELTASQGVVLGYLSRQQEAKCPRDIEEAFHLSHACTAGILSRLEKKGFLEFKPDETDRRCKRVYLTEKAAAVHAHMLECIAGIEERMIQDFTLEEQQQFVALLDRAIANMGSQVMKEES